MEIKSYPFLNKEHRPISIKRSQPEIYNKMMEFLK